jgi:indole-3-glycerol phosphate synthase
MRQAAENAPAVRPFGIALTGARVGLIAEVKKASPSRGLLRSDFDPVRLATEYRDGGAAAISVLTDEKHFRGSLSDLRSVRDALPDGPPLLRKDFLFEEYQLHEARYYGADAVLLITAILETSGLRSLIALAASLAMDALVEAHDEHELERAVAAGAKIIGINNRDLRTFHVDLATTERLAPLVPPGTTIVAESGIVTREDVRRLEMCGVHAVLIGEALVTAPDPGAKIRELFG